MRVKAGSSAVPKWTRPSRSIVAKAAMWVSRFDDGDELTAADREEFRRWLRADPRHAEEFQAQAAIGELSRNVPADVRARWLADAHAYERRRFRWRGPLAWAAAGAVVVLVGLIALARLASPRAATPQNLYVTRTAETRTIRLADGSIAVLNTRTRLRWFDSARERRVLLLEGEAFFQVAHDSHRPFHVVVDRTTIEDVGTEFDVYRKPNGRVRLTVLDGAVTVTPEAPVSSQPTWQRLVKMHQQIDYQGTAIVDDVGRATDEDLEWRRGTLRFQQQPLAQVVEELQRYTDQRIVIADADLANVAVGGLYSTRNIGADLARIARFVPMAVQERDGAINLKHLQPEPRDDH